MPKKLIRLSSPGASGAAGGGTTPAALLITFAGSTGHISAPFSASLLATGGVTPYTFSISVGSLPSGLTLDTATGAITGTPTALGAVTFTGHVVDAASTTASVVCTITIDPGTSALTLSFSGSQAQQGASYSASITAFGGVQPYTFAVISGLPPGLSLSTITGAITGTPTTAGTYTASFRVTDAVATTTTCVGFINVTLPSGASALIAISSCTGRDMGHGFDTADPVSRLVSFRVGVACSFLLSPLQYNTVYLSKDAGVTWQWAGWFLWIVNNQEFPIWQLRPSIAQTWRAAAVPGTIEGTNGVPILDANLPAGVRRSSVFSVAALNAPPVSLVSSLTVSPGTGSDPNFPYDALTNNGEHYFSIQSFTYSDAAAVANADSFFIRLTAQDFDVAGNPIGPELPFAGTAVGATGSTLAWGPLVGNYDIYGWSYYRSGTLSKVRMKVYVGNRANQSTYSFTDPTSMTLQTSVGGGAGYIDVVVSATGGNPPGSVLQNMMAGVTRSVNTGSRGTVVPDPVFGTPTVPNNNQAASVVMDPSFDFSTPGVLGAGGNTPSWNWATGAGGSIEIRNDGGHSGRNYARISGPDTGPVQQISLQPGYVFFVQVALRSSNTAGPAHAIGLYVEYYDASERLLNAGNTGIGFASGFVSAWTNPGISAYVSAPGNAARCNIKIATGAGETGYWDVDDVFVQHVQNQTTGAGTTSSAQASTSGGTAAFRATGPTSHAEYGQEYALISGSFGEFANLGPNSLGLTYGVGLGGIVFLLCGNDAGTKRIQMQCDDTNGPLITLATGGVNYTGYTGTVQTAFSANKPVRGGVICS